jgi:tetratricopeptide (TPR) repeat protein
MPTLEPRSNLCRPPPERADVVETPTPDLIDPARNAENGGASLGCGWRGAALIFLLTLAAYAPVFRAGFIWNDEDYVTQPALRSLHGLWRIWFEVGATQQYYPALHSAFWIEYLLWGDAPLGYHLLNVLLHATAACLLVLVLRRLAVPGAFLAGLIFALHPVCVETVAWVSEEKNTLSTVFYLWAALTYLRWREVGTGGPPVRNKLETSPDRSDGRAASPAAASAPARPCLYICATALFVLAVASKSEAATLPAALLVVLWWKQGRLSWRTDAVPLLPWFGVAVAGGLITAWVEVSDIGARGADFALTFTQRFLVAGRAVWFYLGKLLWPAHLIFIYPRWRIDAGAAWQYFFPVAALGLWAALWLVRRRTRAPLAVLLIFIGTLFPILGFFNVFAFLFSFVADHFLYLASLGIIAFVSAGWGLWHRADRRLSLVAAGLTLGVLGVLTWRQSGMYRDIETFYRVTLERNPAAWMAHNNLGVLLEDSGRTSEAIEHYEAALRLKPDFVESHNNLGVALATARRPQEALAEYQRALQLNPLSLSAHLNLGNLLRDTGRLPEALAEYDQALRIQPNSPEAHNNRGIALAQAGRLSEAIGECREAVRLNPGYVQGHYDLGLALHRARRFAEEVAEYEAALTLQPGFSDARNNLGIVLAETGNLDGAEEQFETALRFNPNDGKAHANLAVVLRHLGQTQAADAQEREAQRLRAASSP